MLRLPKIESLDLRTREGRRIAASRRFAELCDRVNLAFKAMRYEEVAWTDWDEISWDDPRHSVRVEERPMFGYWRVMKKRLPCGCCWEIVNEEPMSKDEILGLCGSKR